MRFSLKDLERDYEKTEDDIKAVQSVGQIIGEVMKQLDDERCTSHPIAFWILLTFYPVIVRHPRALAMSYRIDQHYLWRS